MFFILFYSILFYFILFYLFCFILSLSGHLSKDVLLYHPLFIVMPIASTVFVTLRNLSLIILSSYTFFNAHAVNCLNISLQSWYKFKYTCFTPDCAESMNAMLTLCQYLVLTLISFLISIFVTKFSITYFILFYFCAESTTAMLTLMPIFRFNFNIILDILFRF